MKTGSFERGLSPREIEVLTRIGEGYTNRQIADDLAITEETAKVHVRTLLAKLRMANRTQAAVWLVKHRHNLDALILPC
jgi:DNA-binding NarL/FixJ family response regulator